MKNALLYIILTIISINLFGQKKNEILKEGYLLYHSEQASWLSTDLFLEKFPQKQTMINGYFSYSKDSTHHSIFYAEDTNGKPQVIASFTFNHEFDTKKIQIDSLTRNLTEKEYNLYAIREKAFKTINKYKSFFKSFENSNLNIIPLITEKERKVYVLTGPSVSGVVLFGNDYLLNFDKNNQLISKKSLHNNLIPIEYSNETKEAIATHSHLKSTGNLITATDICTLLLYQNYANWAQHIVISNKNVSLWNCKTNDLNIISKKAWNKIKNN